MVNAFNDGDTNIYVVDGSGKRTNEIIGSTLNPFDFMTTDDKTGAFTFDPSQAGQTFRFDDATVSRTIKNADGTHASIQAANLQVLVSWGKSLFLRELRLRSPDSFYDELGILKDLSRNGGPLDFKTSLGLNPYTPVQVGSKGSRTITTLRAAGNIAFGANMKATEPIYMGSAFYYEHVMQKVGEYNQAQNSGKGYNPGYPFYGEHTYSGSYIFYGFFGQFPK